jgi:hypothetical protein
LDIRIVLSKTSKIRNTDSKMLKVKFEEKLLNNFVGVYIKKESPKLLGLSF